MTNTADPEGAIRLHVHEVISPRELATWSPERITAFFAGIAQVIEAVGQRAPGSEVRHVSDDPKDQEEPKDSDPDSPKDGDESDRGKDPQAP